HAIDVSLRTELGYELLHAWGDAPNAVTSRATSHGHAVAAVGQGGPAGHVGADEVSFDHVACGVRILEKDAIAPVAGDDVTRPGRRAADKVGCRSPLQHYAGGRSPQGSRSRGINADIVAFDHVAYCWDGGSQGIDNDLVGIVSRNHVSCR